MNLPSRLHLTLQDEGNFPVPEVPAVVKDDDGTDNSEGVVDRAQLDQPLKVIVPEWAFSTDPLIPDVLELGWRPDGAAFKSVAEETFTPPIDPGDKTLYVPAELLQQGLYSLSYRVTRRSNHTDSVIKRITIDSTPPNGGQQPLPAQFPDDLLGVITDDYLNEHGEVIARVPAYLGMREKDRAVFYWSEFDVLPGETPALGAREFTQEEVEARILPLEIAEADIRGNGAGRRYLYYRLYDLAGNEGPLSYVSPIQVDLVPAPSDLPAPTVPLSARGLIDRQHAREGAEDQGGVTVEIERYDNAEATHFVAIDWGGAELHEMPVDPDSFPLRSFVPWRDLVASGLGPDRVQVSYRIRYGSSYSNPSPAITVPFDFTVAGQDHANAPALRNSELARVEVRGAVSDLPNQLTAQDEKHDARLLVTLFDDPQPGEYLEVYWGAVPEPAARYDVQVGDAAGKPLELAVPWAIVEQDKNNVALPVYYLTNNGVNQQEAGATLVSVVIVPIVGLPEPTAPQATRQGFLNCCATPRIWEGVTLHVDGHSSFAQDDTVEFHWQGYEDQGALRPIPGTEWSTVKRLSASEATGGFEVVVLPYSTHIEPMENRASTVFSYTLTKADGGFGRSPEAHYYIDRTMPSGLVCGPENDLCDET